MMILPMMTVLGSRYHGSPVTTPLGAARLGFVLGGSPGAPVEESWHDDAEGLDIDDPEFDIDVEDPDAAGPWLDVDLSEVEDDRLLEAFR